MEDKKYVLKPGNHQFAIGGPAIHNNENTDDDQAAWYLQRFPHLANLFESMPPSVAVDPGKVEEHPQPDNNRVPSEITTIIKKKTTSKP